MPSVSNAISKLPSGKRTTNKAVYGFIKDPQDKTKWVVDTEAAIVIRRIFQMTIEGMGPGTIATTLCAERVEKPGYHMTRIGVGDHQWEDEKYRYEWRSSTVAKIIARPEYCGHTVNLRTGKAILKKGRDVYCCSLYQIHRGDCTMHYISTEQVGELILVTIRGATAYARSNEAEFIDTIREASTIRQSEIAKNNKKQIARNEKRIAELDTLFRKTFEETCSVGWMSLVSKSICNFNIWFNNVALWVVL